MELYYVIHILVFLSLIFEFFSLEIKKRVIILWAIFFTLFGGLRWRIGGDWDQYYDHFLFSDFSNIFSYDRYGNGRELLEPGFVFINALIRHLFGTFYWYNLIVCGFIQFTLYHFCIRFCKPHPLLMYCWIIVAAYNYFPVRSGLAVGVIYWAYYYLQNRNLQRYLIIVLIASFIHNQSLIMLPLYWIGKVKINVKSFTFIYAVFILNAIVFKEYFSFWTASLGGDLGDKAYLYTQVETDGFEGASYSSWCLNYLLGLFFLWFRNRWDLDDDIWYNTLINFFVLYMGIFIVFSQGSGDLTRLNASIGIAFVIIFVTTISRMIDSSNRIYSSSALLFYLCYYLYKFNQVGTGYFFKEVNVPYKTIFDYPLFS